jgi:hypothetical protein
MKKGKKTGKNPRFFTEKMQKALDAAGRIWYSDFTCQVFFLCLLREANRLRPAQPNLKEVPNNAR